jgi:hypothetical protein
MSRLVRFLMPIMIAVVLGPLIAGIAVTVLALVINLVERSAAAQIGDVLALSASYVIFAYVRGAAIAVFAGLLVSIWMIWRAPSFAIVIAATVIATVGYMSAGALGMLGAVEITNARSNFVFTLIFAVIAAAGCWLLTRRFARTA